MLMMVSSLGIVAGLSWNDAIKSLFDKGMPLHDAKSSGVWIAALAITAIAYLVTAMFIRLYPEEEGVASRPSPLRM